MRQGEVYFVLSALTLLFFFSGLNDVYAQKDLDDIVIGKYQAVHSHVLNEDRLLFVHLPREYGESRMSYPVLYLLWVDVYNYFMDAVMVTEKLSSSGEIPPVIIVGVANTDRYRDLLPVKNRDSGQGGGADNFLRFLGDELIPHVDKTYRTKNFRILAGPQAGAIFGLYALIAKPGLFQAVLLDNPFLNPENAAFLYPLAEQYFKKTESSNNFLYIKCEKNESPQGLDYAARFSGLLESGKPAGFRFKVEFAEPSGYFIKPLPFRDGLRMLFAGHRLPENISIAGLKDILKYYEALSAEYGFEVDPPPHLLTMEGDKLNRQRKTREALEVFEYMLSRDPRSLSALWQLGEISRGLGEYEKARDYYKNFLEIRDIDAALVRTRLDQVERIIGSSAVYRVEIEIKRGGLEAGLKKYREIKSDPRSTLYFEEAELNALGYRLMGAGNLEGATEIFKLTVELFPRSANAYDSLAEAHLNGGDTANAIKNYRKSLELNPANTNAQEMLTAAVARQEARIPLDGRGGGIIAFYSENRGGHKNAEIYVMNADGTGETNLTQHQAEDLAPDLSPDGSQIVFVSNRDGQEEIYKMKTDGSGLSRLTNSRFKKAYPYWSADGTKIIYGAHRNGNWDVFLMDEDGSDQTEITNTPGNEEWAFLSPDMTRIVYATGNFPDYDLYVMNADGSHPRALVTLPQAQALPKWSRDGKTIAHNYGIFSDGSFTGDIYLVNADGTNSRKITDSQGKSINENPYWSPDGTRIVFQSNRSGNFQIYVMNADGSQPKRLTHHEGNDYWPCWASSRHEFPILQGPYLGQKPPGMTAEIFAPGIVTTDLNEHGSPTFSPDLSEMYWSPQYKDVGGGRIIFMKMIDWRWQPPKTAAFSQDFKNQNPFLSCDGKRLFFKSFRPIDADVYRNGAFWVSERTSEGWSIPKPLGPYVNSGSMGQQISESMNKNLYYACERPSGKGLWDIYRVIYASGQYSEPENLGDSINTEFYDGSPYISPDEKYLVFSSMSRPDGHGGEDLYVSFRDENGDWTKAINMGPVINTKEHEGYPIVTPDGKYFFFVRNGDIYWVDARIIETLIPTPSPK